MATNTRFETVRRHEIAGAWAGQTADLALHTAGDEQFVAFYAADGAITAGQRRLGESDWTLATVCDERNSLWDNHNSLALTVDDDGHLHLVGDLHVDPLNYFRTTAPRDVTTFERVPEMVGSEEDRTTYPTFLRGPAGELVFKYRHGRSGAGDWIYDVYDHGSREWERLLDDPLLVGGEGVNAYDCGPVPGPDGHYHLAWGWRDHPAAQRQHDIYYARSPDLRSWETSRGEHVSTPIGEGGGELVDPVPPWGGNLNGVEGIGFDGEDRPILTYRKFDADGNTQLYNARAEPESADGLNPEGWELYRTSDWDHRDAFGGVGSLGVELSVSAVERGPDGRLSQTFVHPKHGTGRWVLDEETLRPVEERSPWHRYPAEAREPRGDHPGLTVCWCEDGGSSPGDRTVALRWEADDVNEAFVGPDREAPPPSTLELYEFRRAE